MSIGLHPVKPEQTENVALLASGVRGVACLQAAYKDELKNLDPDQIGALNALARITKNAGMKIGTIEVYSNGAMNVYLRTHGVLTHYALYRRNE